MEMTTLEDLDVTAEELKQGRSSLDFEGLDLISSLVVDKARRLMREADYWEGLLGKPAYEPFSAYPWCSPTILRRDAEVLAQRAAEIQLDLARRPG
jgi:hypothetical protein